MVASVLPAEPLGELSGADPCVQERTVGELRGANLREQAKRRGELSGANPLGQRQQLGGMPRADLREQACGRARFLWGFLLLWVQPRRCMPRGIALVEWRLPSVLSCARGWGSGGCKPALAPAA